MPSLFKSAADILGSEPVERERKHARLVRRGADEAKPGNFA